MQALLPPPSASPPDGTFVTIDAPPLTHHYHAEVRVYTGFTLLVIPSVIFDKCIMTGICGRREMGLWAGQLVFVKWSGTEAFFFTLTLQEQS